MVMVEKQGQCVFQSQAEGLRVSRPRRALLADSFVWPWEGGRTLRAAVWAGSGLCSC